MDRIVFPFTAVLGQEEIKKALIWNLINPGIGGVLISGEKGTAKSTLVRGAARLMEGMKIVELPLNVTEDRLVGAIDLKCALKDGTCRLEPGILSEADGNILYVDEVNLLSDHIVNALLETAASGVNVVEREGISCSHSSRFVLAGSMNQEEGKLRPQLLDRFGLYVEVEGEKDVDTRIEIMKRRLDYERDPISFIAYYNGETKKLKAAIDHAKELLCEVEVTENAMQLAAALASQANCAGHRGEIALIETARAIAAFDKRRMININDIKEASEYALVHRMQEAQSCQMPQDNREEDSGREEDKRQEEQDRQQPEEDIADKSQQDDLKTQTPENDKGMDCENCEGDGTEDGDKDGQQPETGQSGTQQSSDQNRSDQSDDGAAATGEEDIQESGEIFMIRRWQEPQTNCQTYRGSGRRNLVLSNNRQGRYVRYRQAGEEKVTDLAFDATVRAAAPFQRMREKGNRKIAIEKSDLRVKIREKRTGGCILFVVDASASMGANKRMKEVKAAILSLLNVSYQKRDKVGLIAFRRDDAELLLGITRSVELAQKKLEQLPTGGKTPLAKGLCLAYEVIMGLKMKDPDVVPTMVLVSDGRASGKKMPGSNPFDEALKEAERIGNQQIHTIILDTENDFIKFHLCDKLNEKLHGTLLTMEELKADGIIEAVSS
ncbi:VWA domain-containing protein [Robinsoniella peoriensis]|uniref:VWA domain-containing protein n=1 Tax=Robinsoniella peoriensis TaxID=180332 RepID=UPI0036344239